MRNRVIIQYMKNTNEIPQIVNAALARIVERGKHASSAGGYPTAAGFFSATLAHVLMDLNETNPERVAVLLERIADFN